MTAPASPYLDNSTLPAQPFEVLIGDDDGDPCTDEDVADDVQLLTVTRSAGGQKLDHCNLNYSLALSGDRLQDLSTPTGFSRMVQLRIANPDPDAEGPAATVFSGELGVQQAKIVTEGEFAKLQARIEPWHFGDPLLGPLQYDPFIDDEVAPDQLIVFNPEIDGLVCGNMSNLVTGDSHYHYWLDPESVRTDAAEEAEAQSATEWDLANAVYSLCWIANPDEGFITNPTLEDLQGVFGDNPPELRSVILPRGKRLPELLDLLLPRFGFNWFVQPAVDPEDDEDDDPPVNNYLRVFQLGVGTQKQVYLQRPIYPPAVLDVTQSNVPDLDISWNIADLANIVQGQGSQIEVEATFELYRGWDEADDSLTYDQLRKTEETTADDPDEESQYKAKPNVWRRWVLNEAGDYCDLRTSVAPIPDTPFQFGRASLAVTSVVSGDPGAAAFYVAGDQTGYLVTGQQITIVDSTGNDGTYTIAAFAFSTDTVIDVNEAVPDATADGNLIISGILGSKSVVKRRRFHHCLTWGADLERRDVFVQYRDNSVSGDSSPGAWKALTEETWSNIHFTVLEKECGIYFDGPTPPPDLMALDGIEAQYGAGSARLRITAAIRSDDRINFESPPAFLSPNANTIKLFLDVSDRFHLRTIQQDGLYASALAAETYGNDTRDDTENLQAFVKAIQTIEAPARISCDLELIGINTGYEIGDLITAVNGRNISLNRNAQFNATKLYPQITSITYDRVRQRTILRVENFDFRPPALRKLGL